MGVAFDQAVQAIGWMGLAAGLARFGQGWAAGWLNGRRLEKVRASGRTAFDERVDLARQQHQSSTAAQPAWQGWRRFLVLEKSPEDAPDLCTLRLAPQDGRALPAYRPGQYLTLQLRTPQSERPTVRCYSLTREPAKDAYEITVKRLAPPADRPELPRGQGSSYIHDDVAAGDVLELQAPRGTFCLDPVPGERCVLIGSGVGVTPLLSMLRSMAASGCGRETWLFYGVRNGRHHLRRDELQRLGALPNLHVVVCYSRPEAVDEAAGGYHQGRIDIALLQRTLAGPQGEFFLCGPAAMLQQLYPALHEWGVPDERLHFEAFGPASVQRRTRPAVSQAAARAAPFRVTFTRSGRSCEWDARWPSLLALAESQGVPIDAGCRVGNCGSCETRVEAGDVGYPGATGARPAAGACLVCLAVPTSDLSLEA